MQSWKRRNIPETSFTYMTRSSALGSFTSSTTLMGSKQRRTPTSPAIKQKHARLVIRLATQSLLSQWSWTWTWPPTITSLSIVDILQAS